MDGQGRIFFVDHNTKTTSWVPPSRDSVSSFANEFMIAETDEQLARRLQMEDRSKLRGDELTQRNMINDEELARLLQNEEDAALESESKDSKGKEKASIGFFGRRRMSLGIDTRGFPEADEDVKFCVN